MPESLRIVSLLPSATEIVAALGLAEWIVGRSHECDYPPEIQTRPICTAAKVDAGKPSAQIDADVQTLLRSALSLYDIQLERLASLQPTHIVTQDQCDVCAVNFALVEAAVATLSQPQPQVISLQPHRLRDVWTDMERVATQLGVDARPVLNGLHTRIEQCQQQIRDVPTDERPRVAAIEWIDPLMGSGSWIPELVELAGGRAVLGTAGQPASFFSFDVLMETDPDVLVVMPCGFDLERTEQEMQQAWATYPQWQQLRAVQQAQIYLVDGNAYFNRPGPRLVDSLEILAEILHPTRFERRYELQWRQYQR